MATPLEYMQIATGVYAASDRNLIDAPANWSPLDWKPDGWTGFSAGVYKNDLTNEFVISYKGTNQGIDIVSWTAGLGYPAPQILDAMAYYFAFRKAHPEVTNGNISFTGHSLGGGLASLMAVYFDKPATVFDQAPFQPAALSPSVLPLLPLAMAASGYFDAKLALYIASPILLALSRESNVTQYYVDGEVLQSFRFPANTLVGTDIPLSLKDSTASKDDRHSMTLLTALKASEAFLFSAGNLPDLVTEILDPGLYATSSTNPDVSDFLRTLLRHQLGVRGVIQPDAMLDHFAADMNKLTNYGTNLITGAMGKSLIDVAIANYYAMTPGFTKEFFNTLSGGISFDLKDIGANWANNKTVRQLGDTIAAQLLNRDQRARSFLAQDNYWTIQSGDTALNTTGAGTNNDAMIGGFGSDTLDGGAGNDLLFGGDGIDTLTGGADNDLLIGGAGADTMYGGSGYDTYVIEGNDTIEDSDGKGAIRDKAGNIVSGAILKRTDGTYVYLADPGIGVTKGADLSLTLDSGNVAVIKNFQSGNLGLMFVDDGQTQAPTSRTISGDLAPLNNPPQYDSLDNVIVNPGAPQPGRNDVLYDSAGNDLIQGFGGNDFIDAWRGGNDKLDGGTGTDIVSGRAGDDLVIGGEEADLLRGDEGKDKLYATSEVTVEAALAAQDAAPSGLKGDFFDGGADDDTLIGDSGNDALNGGAGADIIVAGAGDDDIDGDLETSIVSLDWSITRSVTTQNGVTQYLTTYNGVGFTAPPSI